MASRAHNKIQNALIQSFRVPTAKAVTAGFRVKFSGADDAIENCAAGEDGIGIALEDGVALQNGVTVALDGVAIVPVKVGTGGATRGLFARFAADGFTDQIVTDGTVVRFLAGRFMQSGPVGDMVGLLIGVATPNATA
jgi:hypothetical protein